MGSASDEQGFKVLEDVVSRLQGEAAPLGWHQGRHAPRRAPPSCPRGHHAPLSKARVLGAAATLTREGCCENHSPRWFEELPGRVWLSPSSAFSAGKSGPPEVLAESRLASRVLAACRAAWPLSGGPASSPQIRGEAREWPGRPRGPSRPTPIPLSDLLP